MIPPARRRARATDNRPACRFPVQLHTEWLAEQQVGCVALESTGVYWLPVYTLLEEAGHQVLLVHPQHMEAVPGHKTDIADSKWLADLLRHGPLKPSFIPPAAIRGLRELQRYRTTPVRERSAETNRLQQVLESVNLPAPYPAYAKLRSVAGRTMSSTSTAAPGSLRTITSTSGAACST